MEARPKVFFFERGKQPVSLSPDLLAKESVSVFESVRSYQGTIFRLEEHLKRLSASAKTVGIQIPEAPSALKKILYRALRESGRKNAFLRLTVTSKGTFVLLTARAYSREVFEKGVRLCTSVVRKNISGAFYPEAKSSNYGSQMLATIEMPRHAFEVLFLSQEGYVRESRTSNIFIIKQEVLFTPPSVAVLEGVTRKIVIEMARELSLPTQEVFFTRHDLFNAEEAFLTNTSGELIPIREVDGRSVGRKIPGSWTRRFMKRFQAKVKQYIRQHKEGQSGVEN